MNVDTTILTPVILSGGSGSRLWPLSRPDRPKQFLPVLSDASLLKMTLMRAKMLPGCTRPVVVANHAHAALVAAECEDDVTIILEPCARNTAPAIALAALVAAGSGGANGNATLLVMPSDHSIADLDAFRHAVALALPMVQHGWMVTLGIRPDHPETGYGYIALGDELAQGVHRVARFVEKPDADRAAAMIASGDHMWNAGIFLFRASDYLDALARFEPDMLAAVRASLADADLSAMQIRPDHSAFAASPSNSIDYAVMERAQQVACVPVEMGWSDVGSWDAIADISVSDDAGNVASGDTTLIDTQNCLVRSDGPHVTLVGVSDLIVVANGNDIMIVPRGQAQLVKLAAEAAGRRDR